MDWKGFNDQELGLLILLLYPSVIFSDLLNSYDKLTVGNVDTFFDFVEYKFEFDRNTFYLEGSGKTRLTAKLTNDDSLPPWLVFLPSQFMFAGTPPQESGSIDITVEATNDVSFV